MFVDIFEDSIILHDGLSVSDRLSLLLLWGL